MRLIRLLLLFSLSCLTVGAMAQPADSADKASPAGGNEQEAPATAPAAEPAAQEPPTEPQDPFDYEASEQISEDLSVSFPVDI